ncbi:MAG: hypothetical protein E6556_11665 [Pantoea sp.]|nr:hypothetical protein [Pantoea sp.]
MNKQYAVLKKGESLVQNTIVAPAGFGIDNYILIELTESNTAQPGAYYNSADGRFYGDANFQTDCHQLVFI